MVGMEGLGVALNLYKFDIEFDRQTLPKVEFDIELIRSFVPEPTSGPHIMNLYIFMDAGVWTWSSVWLQWTYSPHNGMYSWNFNTHGMIWTSAETRLTYVADFPEPEGYWL